MILRIAGETIVTFAAQKKHLRIKNRQMNNRVFCKSNSNQNDALASDPSKQVIFLAGQSDLSPAQLRTEWTLTMRMWCRWILLTINGSHLPDLSLFG